MRYAVSVSGQTKENHMTKEEIIEYLASLEENQVLNFDE